MYNFPGLKHLGRERMQERHGRAGIHPRHDLGRLVVDFLREILNQDAGTLIQGDFIGVLGT